MKQIILPSSEELREQIERGYYGRMTQTESISRTLTPFIGQRVTPALIALVQRAVAASQDTTIVQPLAPELSS